MHLAFRLSIAFEAMAFEPGVEHRRFMQVPHGATWAEMTLRAGAHAAPKLFMVHATQLTPHARPTQFRQALSLTSQATQRATFAVTGGEGLEVAVAQFWKTDGDSELSVEVAFHGIGVNNRRVALVGSDHIVPLKVRRGLPIGVTACFRVRRPVLLIALARLSAKVSYLHAIHMCMRSSCSSRLSDCCICFIALCE